MLSMVTPLYTQSIPLVIDGYYTFMVESILISTGTSSSSQFTYPKFQTDRFLMADLFNTHLHIVTCC
jgi:hypothetical protein